MNKVHFRNIHGKVVCNPGRDWTSSELIIMVTCPNCKRIIAKSIQA